MSETTIAPPKKRGRPKKIVLEAPVQTEVQKDMLLLTGLKPIKDVFEQRKKSLTEVYSSSNVTEFSLLTTKHKLLHPFFRCKDYYHDLFYTMNTGKEISVYGYNSGKMKSKKNMELVNDKEFIMAIRYRTTGEKFDLSILIGKDKLESNLNKICELLGFNPCSVLINTEENYLMIYFDSKWTIHPLFISLFTSFVRLLSKVNYDFTTFESFYNDLKGFSGVGIDSGNFISLGERIKNLDKIYNTKHISPFNYHLRITSDAYSIHNGGYKAILSGLPLGESLNENKTFKDMIIEIQEDIESNKRKNTETSSPVTA